MEKRIQKAQEALDAAYRDIEELRVRKGAAVGQIDPQSELERRSDELQKQNEDYQLELERQKATISQLQAQSTSFEAQYQEAKWAERNITLAHAGAVTTARNEMDRKDKLEKSLSLSQEANKKLEERASKLEQDLAAAIAKQEFMAKENGKAFHEWYEMKHTELPEYKFQRDVARLFKKDAEKALKEAEKALEDAEKTKEKAERERHEMRVELENTCEERDTLAKNLEDAMRQIRELKEELYGGDDEEGDETEDETGGDAMQTD